MILLVFALPPVVDFIAFLFSGEGWRALLGVSVIALVSGLALLILAGRYDLKRVRPLVTLSWTLIALSPICVVVALIGSGWLESIVEAIHDLFS